MEQQPDEIPFSCKLCKRVFRNNNALESHGRHYPKKDCLEALHCKICNQTFVKPSNLRYHTKIVHSGRAPLRCTKCDYKTMHRKCLVYHLNQLASKGEPLNCPHCSEKYCSEKLLIGHCKNVHPQLPRYNICRGGEQTKEQRLIHSIDDIAPGSSISRKISRNLEQQPKQLEQPHLCWYCSKSLDQTEALQKHFLDCHKDVVLISKAKIHFLCGRCSKMCEKGFCLFLEVPSLPENASIYPCTFPMCSFTANRPDLVGLHYFGQHCDQGVPFMVSDEWFQLTEEMHQHFLTAHEKSVSVIGIGNESSYPGLDKTPNWKFAGVSILSSDSDITVKYFPLADSNNSAGVNLEKKEKFNVKGILIRKGKLSFIS